MAIIMFSLGDPHPPYYVRPESVHADVSIAQIIMHLLLCIYYYYLLFIINYYMDRMVTINAWAFTQQRVPR